ncbi:transcription termination factor MTERF8, chloroplastic-like [Henckelia pumila]|uniref:transcription termination factor MTERF8, chloroplastic-like n=1 Tax=Henckelia pumila TaxID=405737 RepID=UPI003C6DC853
MVSSIWKTLFIRNVGAGRPFLHECPCHARRNVSSIFLVYRLFFSSRSTEGSYAIENAKLVTNILRDYGFDDTAISKVARLCPSIYRLSAEKNILPKLEFFISIGISSSDLPKVLLRRPRVFASSLKNQIAPCYDYLKMFPDCEERFIQMLKYRPGILLSNVDKCLAPNLDLLRGLEIPMSSIAFLVTRCAPAMSRNHDKFKGFVNQLVAMGMNPLIKTFISALHVLCAVSKETWEVKVKLYKSFGLSDEEIISAFKKQPSIMALSVKKLARTMEFLMNEKSLDKLVIVNDPSVLLLSFENRIAPRFHVVEILIKKGLEKKFSYSFFLRLKEEEFLERYCYKFKDELPELMDIYSEGRSILKKCESSCFST